ncbi:MAG: T9SS type A sorting domain-containing protein [Rhodothermales bacterium]
MMHLFVLAALLGLCSALPANAQRPDRHGDSAQRAERYLNFLDEKLDLSDAQEEQIQSVWDDQREAAQAWREANPDATREERQAYREEQRSEINAATEAILTPEQTEQYQSLKDEWTERRGDRPNRGDRPDRGDRSDQGNRRGRRHDGRQGDRTSELVERLDLTEAQQAQLKEIRTTYREAAQAWREANPEATREEKQAYRTEQREAMKAAIEAVLTPEQVTELERLQAERGERSRKRHGHEGDADSTAAQRSEPEADAPAESTFGLENYPNPFNPSTEIQFTLPEASPVTLVVYDIQGREVARLLEGQQEAGSHAVTFNAANLPTGTYIYRLTAGAVTESGRMVLMK